MLKKICIPYIILILLLSGCVIESDENKYYNPNMAFDYDNNHIYYYIQLYDKQNPTYNMIQYNIHSKEKKNLNETIQQMRFQIHQNELYRLGNDDMQHSVIYKDNLNKVKENILCKLPEENFIYGPNINFRFFDRKLYYVDNGLYDINNGKIKKIKEAISDFYIKNKTIYTVTNYNKIVSSDLKGNNEKIILTLDDILLSDQPQIIFNLATEGGIKNICITDKYIFFLAHNILLSNGAVYRSDLDGKNITLIANTSRIHEFQVTDTNIFYNENSKIYRCDFNGNDKKLIAENARHFCIGKDRIYFENYTRPFEDYYLYSVDFNGEQCELIDSFQINREMKE